MLELIGRYVDNPALLYVIIIVLFVVIVGGSLYLTPRLAAKLDERKNCPENKSFYDGMLTEDPNVPKAVTAEDEEKE